MNWDLGKLIGIPATYELLDIFHSTDNIELPSTKHLCNIIYISRNIIFNYDILFRINEFNKHVL